MAIGPREGVLLGANLRRAIATNGDLLSQRRGPLPKLLWADLLFFIIIINYIIRTCCAVTVTVNHGSGRGALRRERCKAPQTSSVRAGWAASATTKPVVINIIVIIVDAFGLTENELLRLASAAQDTHYKTRNRSPTVACGTYVRRFLNAYISSTVVFVIRRRQRRRGWKTCIFGVPRAHSVPLFLMHIAAITRHHAHMHRRHSGSVADEYRALSGWMARPDPDGVRTPAEPRLPLDGPQLRADIFCTATRGLHLMAVRVPLKPVRPP